MGTKMINRRLFLQSISASAFMPNTVWGSVRKNDIFISGSRQKGGYTISAFDRNGVAQYDIALPERAHAIVVNPVNNHGAIFARRPDTFIVIFDVNTGYVHKTIQAEKKRHFYGHGHYTADGTLLFSTEKNIDTGNGVVGIWDVKNSYKRIGEIPSFGIGPHEMSMLHDNKTLVVAVGGIQTQGRKKTNIDTMKPSLNYIDLHSGKLLGKYTLGNKYDKLSIRHLDVGDNDIVAFACQDQNQKGALHSLVGFHNARQSDTLQLSQTPKHVLPHMKKYCGSVKMDKSKSFVAVSSPRGGLVSIWSTVKQSIVGVVRFDDSCGIASTHKAGEFLLTSGTDGCMLYDAFTGKEKFLDTAFVLSKDWDNHAMGVGI